MAVVLGRKGGGAGGGAPSGAAGGDLGGTYPNPAVAVVDDDVLGSGTPDATMFLRGDRAWDLPPGYEFGYDEVTANVTVSSATEATGTTVISCAAHVFDGEPVVAEFFCVDAAPAGVAGNDILVSLFEGATQIGRIAYVLNPAAANTAVPLIGKLRFTPTVGSHTYTVTAVRLGGINGSLVAGSGGTGGWAPMFIRFTKA